VFVHSWAHVQDAVIFDDVQIGRHAKVRRAIIDKGVRIPAGEHIGSDLDRESRALHRHRQRRRRNSQGVHVLLDDFQTSHRRVSV